MNDSLSRALDQSIVRLETSVSPHRVGAMRETPEEFAQAFEHLLGLVQRWNRVHDLTSATDFERLSDLYLADAWVVAQLGAGSSDWVDVGSGGGAPGLTLALLRPTLNLTLVEPRRKRISFLRSAIGQLGLADRVRVQASRSTEMPASGFDVAVSRATLPPLAWLREGSRLARRQVWVLLSKETDLLAELDASVAHAGWQRRVECRYDWPLTGTPRVAIAYETGLA